MKWIDLAEEVRGRPWLTLTDLSDLNYALNALIDMSLRGVKLVAIEDDVYIEVRGQLTPLILDEFQGRPVFSVGDLL